MVLGLLKRGKSAHNTSHETLGNYHAHALEKANFLTGPQCHNAEKAVDDLGDKAFRSSFQVNKHQSCCVERELAGS